MAWSGSGIFRVFVSDAFANATAYDLSGASIDTFKAALFNGSITPDKDVSAANSGFNAGQWANTNEVSDTTGWAAGGRVLDNPAISNPSSGVIMWDADDEVGGACTTGLTGFYGAHVYDDTLASDLGISFNYFGGTNTVAAGGTATVVFSANGVFRITV